MKQEEIFLWKDKDSPFSLTWWRVKDVWVALLALGLDALTVEMCHQMGPDLNPIEHLWREHKAAVRKSFYNVLFFLQ